MPSLSRPLRAWCLCLRASDTRIQHEATAFFHERDAALGCDHNVLLPAWGIKMLVAPVRLNRHGERWTAAARKLGMHEESLRPWIQRGVLKVNYDSCRPHGYKGKPCPIVHASAPLDPNSFSGGKDDPLWNNIWHVHESRIPDQFECNLIRTARFMIYKSGRHQRGWNWVCPGRTNPATGQHEPCDRIVHRVYSPLTVFTIQNFLGPEGLATALNDAAIDPDDPDAFNVHALIRALRDPLVGYRSFACRHCWRVRYNNFAEPHRAWNQFVSYISGGLLRGREVLMPAEYRDANHRRHAYSPQRNRAPSSRRQQVLDLWTTTPMTYRQIARQLGVGYATVHTHIRHLYRQYNAHSRADLAAAIKRAIRPAASEGRPSSTASAA